jgi:nucleotide-binding universal stress UspA family protein
MLRSILVPLDRSTFAEQALPLAACIARKAGARLDLVEVHGSYFKDNPHACWAPQGHELDVDLKQREASYLDAVAKKAAGSSPAPVTTALLPGSDVLPETVAESILARARASKADLIVTTTHAPGALTCVAMGSVAAELVRRSSVPVILVRPGETAREATPAPDVDDILVPLDGSPLAEQVLAPAAELARVMGARCHLLQVVEPTTSGEQAEKAQAEAYLQRIAAGLREQGLEVRARAVFAWDAAGAILAEADEQGSKLIALATHGRGGLEWLMLGSVADQLVRRAPTPVLVYRPGSSGRSE